MAASATAAPPGAEPAAAPRAPSASSSHPPADDFRGVPGSASTSAVRATSGREALNSNQDMNGKRQLSSSRSPAGPPPSPKRMLLPGETALLEYRQLAKKYEADGVTSYTLPAMTEDELDNFGWQWPTNITVPPSPYCLPVQALSHEPTAEEIYKFFFKGTPKEVCIRQVFFHTPLSEEEQEWLQQFRQLCVEKKWAIPYFMEPQLLRVLWFCKRKFPDDAIAKSLEHAQGMVEWRREFYPLSDAEPELSQLLSLGVMYWVGRDPSLRPLLIVKLSRLPKTTAPDLFKRLTIFCFEWALRFLMVPGVVETCVVLFDVRSVPLHQFPISALTDMVNTLTKQFPFRLHRMWIINDSFFVQTVWNIAKQFLTEVQQQKMKFYRSGFEPELLKDYAAHQIEKHYGGSREEITKFYPFPLAPPPFNIDAKAADSKLPPELPMLAVDRFTTFGVIWEGDCITPIQWSPDARRVFEANHLPPPPAAATLEDAETAEALAAVEAATLEQRTASIRTYKSAASSVNRKASLLQRLHLSYGGGNEEAPAEGTPEIRPSQTAEVEGKEEQAAAETHAAEGKEQEDKDVGAKDATEEELNQAALSPEGANVPEAAEARGLVGGAISRRLSKPAETLRRDKEGEEAKSQKPDEAAPEVVKEEEEAKDVKHQPSAPNLQPKKTASETPQTAPPAQKVNGGKCCKGCVIQ
ncbi:cral trio domain-containing protein [Cystoisospora suis]|uniref:Cral trio domain-containing protein n=1 Tax=Cystoisospora suis TaxID=483139 RepID=A0A2C6L8L3_9APIC|nr:cral trio domain-containing protein [Cystoisospora suis]